MAQHKLINHGSIGPQTLSTGGEVINTGTIAAGSANAALTILEGIGTVDNAGSITGGQLGIDLAAGGVVRNRVTGHIGGDHFAIEVTGGAGTVVNNGTILGGGFGIDLGAGGRVVNGHDAGIAGYKYGVAVAGAAGFVSNGGTIVGGNEVGQVDSGAGITLSAGGTVINESSGELFGYGCGVVVAGATGTVENAGTIFGGGYAAVGGNGIILSDGGLAANQAGGRIDAYQTGIVARGDVATVTNAGSIQTGFDGIDLLAGGSVTNEKGGTIVCSFTGIDVTAGGTVANAGSIDGYFGVNLQSATVGNFVNEKSGIVNGFEVAVVTSGADTVVNAGHITSDTTAVYMLAGGVVTNLRSGVIDGETFGVIVDGSGGEVVNAGRIYPGITLWDGGTVTNQSGGRITGEDGISVSGAVGTITNDGMIRGFAAGVQLAYGGTLTDSGTIFGATVAVSFGGSGPNLLILKPGAVFDGNVVSTSAATGTVELAGGGGGTVATIGAGREVQGFGVLQAEAGASWTLQETNLRTLQNAGSLLLGSGTVTLGSSSGSVTPALINAGSLSVAALLLVEGATTNDGLIQVVDASSTFDGVVGGSGQIAVGPSAAISFLGSVDVGQSVGFATSGATLTLADPAAFQAVIGGFALGGTVDVTAVTADSASFSGGTLRLSDGGAAVASLQFSGALTTPNFALAPDGGGGTLIRYHA